MCANQTIRDPKMQAFRDAGGHNAPAYEYLIFLREMTALFVAERGACECVDPVDQGAFTHFVVDRVAAGVRYDVYSSRLVA